MKLGKKEIHSIETKAGVGQDKKGGNRQVTWSNRPKKKRKIEEGP